MALHLVSSSAPLADCAFVHDSVPAGEILHVFGDIDIPSDAYFERALERAIRPNRNLVIDFSGTTYIGAAVLSVLVRARARLGKRLRLAVPAGAFAARLLSIAQMQRLFTIDNSLQAALSSPDFLACEKSSEFCGFAVP
jgi:anti-anti-sigma factor